MPLAPARPCASPLCPELTHERYCTRHEGTPNRDRRSAAKRGYGRTWQRLRRMVLRREPLCRKCKAEEGIYTAATDVDHIIPKRDGGTDEMSNLQALCHSHHSQKTARETQA